MLDYTSWPRRASGRRRAWLVITLQTSSNTQPQLLSRLAGLGSFVGVRFTRIRSFRSPTLARARESSGTRIRSNGRAQRQRLEGR